MFDARTEDLDYTEHLMELVPFSELCDKHGIRGVNFYKWQKLLFENGAGAFERNTNSANARRSDDANGARIEKLEAKLQQNKEVIAELLEEHVELKKELAEP